jgi:hypothetical protein
MLVEANLKVLYLSFALNMETPEDVAISLKLALLLRRTGMFGISKGLRVGRMRMFPVEYPSGELVGFIN